MSKNIINDGNIYLYIDLKCPICKKEQPISSQCFKCGHRYPELYISSQIKKELKGYNE